MADQSLKGLLKEFLSALTDLEKSFFYTMKTMALSPEEALEDFRGGRRELFPPFRFLMISLFFTVLSYQMTSDIVDDAYFSEKSGYREKIFESRIKDGKSVENFDEEAFAEQRAFIMEYFPMIGKVSFVLAIPLACLVFFLLFRKLQITAAANIVTHIYLGSFLSIVSFPYTVLMAYLGADSTALSIGGSLLSLVYYTYSYHRLSRSYEPYKNSYLRSFFSSALALATVFIVTFALSIGMSLYAFSRFPLFPS